MTNYLLLLFAILRNHVINRPWVESCPGQNHHASPRYFTLGKSILGTGRQITTGTMWLAYRAMAPLHNLATDCIICYHYQSVSSLSFSSEALPGFHIVAVITIICHYRLGSAIPTDCYSLSVAFSYLANSDSALTVSYWLRFATWPKHAECSRTARTCRSDPLSVVQRLSVLTTTRKWSYQIILFIKIKQKYSLKLLARISIHLGSVKCQLQ